MPRYFITEPHPTVPQNAFTHVGRGGAGNLLRAPQTTPPTGVPTPAKTSSKASSQSFFSGRGGAGNKHSAADRVQLNFDDEYVSAATREKTAGFSGRGGAGNVIGSPAMAGSSDRRDSASTDGSVRSGFFQRFSMGSR